MTAKEFMLDRVAIPKWVVTLVLPIIVATIVGLGTYSFSAGEQKRQIEVNTLMIEKKVNLVPEFQMVIKQLDRIENKLDQHIDKD